jgi:phage-related protein
VAVVGEARIVVRAITDGVAEDISRALREAQGGVDKDGNELGKKLSEGIDKGFKNKNPFGKIGESALAAREAFSKLQRRGFAMQTIFGVLAGSVGALVVSIGSLVGALGAAAPSLVAFGGAAIGMGLGMKLASFALKGVTGPLSAVNKAAGATGKTIKQLREEMQQLKFDSEDAALGEKEASLNLEKARETLARVQDMPPNSMARREAELAYEQADLALRRAIDRNNDLKEEIKDGPTQSNAGPDPYAGLTKSQAAFAKLLVGLKPKFDALKEAVAKGFLPALGTAIDSVMTTAFPVLLEGFGKIGTALGNVSTKLGEVVTDAAKSGKLGSLFSTSAVVIEKLGDAIANIFSTVLTLLDAASPVTKEFVGWIDDMTKKFKTFIDKSAKNGKLAKFFEDSSAFAKDFGEIFGNIFGGLGALIEDAFKPGSGAHILLDWLKNATAGFSNIGKDGNLHSFLADSTTNATAMFDTIGKVFDVLMNLADNPNIAKFWKILGDEKSVTAFEKILNDGIDAGPAFANLIGQITTLIASFSDSKTLTTFFDTLSDVAKKLSDFFNDPKVKPIIDALSQFHGWILAIGLLAIVGKKALMIMLGTALKPLMLLTGGFKTLGGVIGGFKTGGFKGGLSKIGEQFGKTGSDKDKFIDNLGKLDGKMDDSTKKTGFFKNAMSKLKDIFGKVADVTKKVASSIADLSKKVWANTVMAVKSAAAWVADKAAKLASRAATLLSSAATAIATGVQAAFNFVLNLNPITLIVIAIAALVAGLIWFFTQTEIGKQAWQAFVDFLIAAWNGVVEFFKAAGQVMMDIFKAIGDFFVTVWNGLVTAVKFVFNLVVEAIKFYINIWVTIFKVAVAAIGAVWNGIVAVFKVIGGFIAGIWDGVVKGFQAGINGFAGFFKTVWNGIQAFFKGFVNGLISMVENFVNFFINGINLIISALSKLNIKIPDWVPLVGGQTWGIKLSPIPKFKLPRLADGGVVSPSAGGTIAQIAEAGRPERVEPLDQNGLSKRDKVLIDKLSGGGAGGINITVNPSQGMDEHELAANISRILGFQLRAGGIA